MLPLLKLTSEDSLLAGLNADFAKRGDLFSNLDSLVHDALAVFDDAAHETPLSGFGSRNLATGQHEVHRALGSDEVRKALSPACARDDTERDLGLRECGVRCAEQDIAHHRELATAAELKY